MGLSLLSLKRTGLNTFDMRRLKIEPIKKTSKPGYWRKLADAEMQQWGRRTYKKCFVCPKKMVCLHHYYPKSTSTSLRYDENNLIPICAGCHFSHHNGNPAIHNKINHIKGIQWLKQLQSKKEIITKTNIKYYKSILEEYAKKTY